MSLIIDKTIPQVKRVKNLGWLLRNWKEVESFSLLPFPAPNTVNDGYLIASMRDGRSYVSTFASFEIARQWLHRPVFRGLPLNDCGQETTC